MDILHNGAITLLHGDCLDVMHEIPDGSVDAIICDIPYGKTSCKWDVVIPFEPMWAALKRIIKPRGAIVLFGSQPFTSALVMSNPKMFRYEWVWNKPAGSNFALVKRQPFKDHENILVFSLHSCAYYPIKQKRTKKGLKRLATPYNVNTTCAGGVTGPKTNQVKGKIYDQLRYPSSVQFFNNRNPKDRGKHPTQKPVALLEYLIRTYTNEGETVLDFTFGSCTAGVAALTTKRRFIGIERDDTYYALGVQRVQTAIDNLPPMDV